jgi:hypothetical protein
VADAIQDNISIAIKEEYMHREEGEEDIEINPNKDITDEDLNQLI